ncbi:major facilitator superfamily domain-containing protein [Xylariales sp. PMI_506]|nr:major facilitator superfamily domain-containing protein [Xylariales sp. PMI_506]
MTGDGSDADAKGNEKAAGEVVARGEESQGPPYTVLTRPYRLMLVTIVAMTGVVSPLTGAIYFPALNTLADDLGVSTSLINLSITTYQIFQGIAPSFIATFSDSRGRRPAFLIALAIYMVANLALALQSSYPALMVLRCLQSAGSSATVVLATASVADVVTRAERGGYVGWTSLGISLGPALGPVIGGLLNGFLGWKAIFWFLLILSGVLFTIIFCFLPETCRPVVGNGSVRPPWWNLSLVQHLRVRRGQPFHGGDAVIAEDRSTIAKTKRRPNVFSTLIILWDPESAIVAVFGALLFAGYFMVMTTLSEQLEARFGFDSVITGLCYLPLGFGSLISRFTAGQLFDRNFKRHARRLKLSIDTNRQQQLEVLPIERIRLEVCLPMIYISCGTVLGYAWAMEEKDSLAGIEVALFFMGLFFSGVIQGLQTLMVDLHSETPGTATAANNLVRCLLSAGATALAPYMIDSIGLGYMGVFIVGVWFVFTPLLWLVLFRGRKWREAKAKAKAERRLAAERKEAESQAV